MTSATVPTTALFIHSNLSPMTRATRHSMSSRPASEKPEQRQVQNTLENRTPNSSKLLGALPPDSKGVGGYIHIDIYIYIYMYSGRHDTDRLYWMIIMFCKIRSCRGVLSRAPQWHAHTFSKRRADTRLLNVEGAGVFLWRILKWKGVFCSTKVGGGGICEMD